jgi:outer membrane protein OmpA-like peptidoglycan-associated protein
VFSQVSEIDVVVVDKQPMKYADGAIGQRLHRCSDICRTTQPAAPEQKNFDQLDFTTHDGDDTHDVTVQGRKIVLTYTPKGGARPASDLEIQENYRVALNNLGAQILFTEGRNTVARLDNKGNPVWVKIYSQQNEIDVGVIEEKAFQASIEPPKADALKTALEKDGHVALYVNFDFAKSTLKPDAKTAGIAKDRLSSTGFGASRPITDNNTTEGRAKNRRVELVKR